jgi:hypothetical protein
MNPHYYLMKNKKILRLESEMTFTSLPGFIQSQVFAPDEIMALDQAQANWRVVLFRDEIMELEEYLEWLASPEAQQEEETYLELVAN